MLSMVDEAQEVSRAESRAEVRRAGTIFMGWEIMTTAPSFQFKAPPCLAAVFIHPEGLPSRILENLDPIDTALQAPEPRGNYLPYTVSRLWQIEKAAPGFNIRDWVQTSIVS